MSCIKEHKLTKTLLTLVGFGLLLFSFPGLALTEKTDQIILLHIKNLKTEKELTLKAIVSTSLEALKHSKKVVIFFDAGAVKAIKIGRWYGGDTTILDKVDFNEEQREKLSKSLNISLASTPSNYGELFRLLRGKGIELYANKTILTELKIEDGQYDTAFEPIDQEQIVDLLLTADVYVSH
jgi:hypothetical protein